MSVSHIELEAIRADYAAVQGRACSFFMCPILLRDEPCELMDGHILNKAFRVAARSTVIQRKDVDNHFGSTIEPDLINRLKNEHANKEQWFEKEKRLFVAGNDGKEIPLLHQGSIKGGIFPRIDLLTDDNSIWGSAYLKASADDLCAQNQIFVGYKYRARNGAVLGSWMKIAYLTMFKLFGYRYVYSAAGESIRNSLGAFVTTNKKNTDSDQAFGHFSGACGSVRGPAVGELRETLTDRAIWVRMIGETIFGITLLFRINNTMHSVTVPWGEAPAKHYERLMNDPMYPHEMRWGVAHCRDLRIESTPLTVPIAPAR